MTAKQYRDAIRALGLSQAGAAQFFKVDDRTARRWALGESEIPEAVAMLLRLMIRLRLKPEQLTEKEFDRIIKLRAQA
jgi:transcriptional regulator with XRE-family HTH domain